MTEEERKRVIEAQMRSRISENAVTTEALFRSAKQLRQAAEATLLQASISAEVGVQLQAVYREVMK